MDDRDNQSMKGRKSKRPAKSSGLKDFLRGNSRFVLVMINAMLLMLVVIIAMGIQLYRLDHPKEQKESVKSESSQKVDEEQQGNEADGESAEAAETKEGADASKDSDQDKPEPIRKDLDPDKPMVALTFDDGPYDVVTDRIVKVLAKNDARATFFVVGNRVDRYAKSMKKAYLNGNQIATHTYDHSDLSKMSKKKIKWEIKKASNTMKKVTGIRPTMLRPPYGTVNHAMRTTIKMPMIFWDVDTQDWLSRNKKKVLQRSKVIGDGDIVLMHDLYPSTADAVKILVPRLRKKGYQLVTVEELFYYKKINAKDGQSYYSGKK